VTRGDKAGAADERLGNMIRVYRARDRLTQEDLAKAVGVSRKTVNMIENKHFVPSTVVALRMAQVFACRVEDLFQLPGHEAPFPPAPRSSQSGNTE